MNAVQSIDLRAFSQLLSLLQREGYQVIGPTVRDGAIIYDEIYSPTDLPIGVTDKQEPGRYRLEERQDRAYFGYNVGPHSWKQFLFPPKRRLWQAIKKEDRFSVKPERIEPKKLAFLGVRACEIEALSIQDKVFIEGESVDPFYQAQRDNAFIISVNCTQAASTCFCTSMQTGPEVKRGYDLCLTEVLDPAHSFVVQAGSDAGAALLQQIQALECTDEQKAAAKEGIKHAEKQMAAGRGMDTRDIKELLYRNVDNIHWDAIAQRCLSCANCTLACPTCFCSDVQDATDLTGNHTERWKSWDSCFNLDHSYVHGGSVRTSTQSRYRQWLTHKLGSWIDQFGSSGCVGCGRCVTWCPVGIDIREEVDALRKSEETS